MGTFKEEEQQIGAQAVLQNGVWAPWVGGGFCWTSRALLLWSLSFCPCYGTQWGHLKMEREKDPDLLSCNTSTAGETSQRSVNVWEQQCCTAPFPRISMASVRMGGNAFTIPLLSSPPLFQPYMQANQAWLPVWLPPSHCLSFGVANPMGNCFSSSHSSHA